MELFMSKSDSSDSTNLSSSSGSSYSKKLSRLIASLCSGKPNEVVEVATLERCEETLDDETRARASRLLEKRLEDADDISESPETIRVLLDQAKNWTERFARKLNSESFKSLTTIFRMLSAAVSGEYQGLSKKTIAYLLAAMMYCVSPIDAIPDAVPIVGLFDDAFVLSWTVGKLASELRMFRMWERLKTAKSVLASYLPYFNDVKHVTIASGWMTYQKDCADEIELLQPVFPNASFERFDWKSNVSWSDARDYVDGQGAIEFEEHLREQGDLGSHVLVGHSLGARLIARTLARLAKEPVRKGFWARRPSNRISQAFLFGAAVDADDPDLSLAASGVNAPLCNFYSRSDLVLSYLYRAAEQKSPLGLSGMSEPCENYVDCVVSGQEEYWLDLAKNASSLLAFLSAGSFLSKLSIADATVSSGLSEHFGHQFKLYCQFFNETVLNEPTDATPEYVEEAIS